MIRRQSLDVESTIFALASGSLPSAVAIIRLSGKKSFDILAKMFSTRIEGRGLYYGNLLDPVSREKIDNVLVLTFVAPHSFTGEEVVEIQCHGSQPIVDKIKDCLVVLGARPAEKGEFSYRALLNEKMSLEQVQELSDIFGASTFRQIENIYQRRRDNSFQAQIEALRSTLLNAQAILDTAVDFSEEYSAVASQSLRVISVAIQQNFAILERFRAISPRGGLPRLVLAGLPNAGKSSLFNLLLSRYRALVHAEAGTTRDVIEEDIRIGGRDWKLVDTAGIRETAEERELAGIGIGTDYLSESQAWIWVNDGTQPAQVPEWYESHRHIPHLIVWNKKDSPAWKVNPSAIGISCQTGEGLPELWKAIQGLAEKVEPEVWTLTQYQLSMLVRVAGRLKSLEEGIRAGLPVEALAEDNRNILQSLESVIGEVSVDDVLDKIFSQFCIGK